MSALAFKGTSIDQDPRWAKKLAKKKKDMKFPAIFATKVDMTKINRDSFKKWSAKKLVELFNGLEDEVLINYVHGYLDQPEIDPKEMLMSLNDMLETDTVGFLEELWKLLVDAQNHTAGIPQAFLDEAKSNIQARHHERDRIVHGMRHMGHSQHVIKHHLPEPHHGGTTSSNPHNTRPSDSDHRYGLQTHAQGPHEDPHREFNERDGHRPHHPRDSGRSHEYDRDEHRRRPYRDDRRYRSDSTQEGDDSRRSSRSRFDDPDRPSHERGRYSRDRRYHDRQYEDRSRDQESRYSKFDDYDGKRTDRDGHPYPPRRQDRHKEENPDVDIFGRDARPNKQNESSPHSSNDKHHRRSGGDSPSLADAYAAASRSKKRSHEPTSGDEDESNTKRSKRTD